MWLVASLEKTEENLEYSGGRVVFIFAAEAATASSVAVVSQATTCEPIGTN